MPPGAIQAIYSGIDFTKDGLNDIVLGRDDGWLEIWGLDDAQQPRIVFSACLPESIVSLDGGFITSPNVQASPMLCQCGMQLGACTVLAKLGPWSRSGCPWMGAHHHRQCGEAGKGMIGPWRARVVHLRARHTADDANDAKDVTT